MICNYGNCLEDVHLTGSGVTVSLQRGDSDNYKRAVFCCAAHAAASLTRLAQERLEEVVEVSRQWRAA